MEFLHLIRRQCGSSAATRLRYLPNCDMLQIKNQNKPKLELWNSILQSGKNKLQKTGALVFHISNGN